MYSEKAFKAFMKDLNSKFNYKRDKDQYGFKEYWTVLSEDMSGDCEDYSLTIRKHFGGDMWFVKINDEGHAVLELPCGRFIDNIQQKRVTREDMEQQGYVFQYQYRWYRFVIKFFQAGCYKLWNKIFK